MWFCNVSKTNNTATNKWHYKKPSKDGEFPIYRTHDIASRTLCCQFGNMINVRSIDFICFRPLLFCTCGTPHHLSNVAWNHVRQERQLYNPFVQIRWIHSSDTVIRHNGRDGVSNNQYHDCLLNSPFRCRSKKTSKLRVTGLCVRNSPVTGEFPAQMASNAENVSVWWRHHGKSS